MKQKAVTIALLALLSTAILFMPLSPVLGQSPTGFGILQVVKQGGFSPITSGTVGEAITVIATLNTPNSSYKIWFGDTLVDSNVSSGYYISSNFTIPEVPAGNFTITLNDAFLDANTTQAFDVAVEYTIKAIVPSSPALLQEGSNVVLNVTMTGGQPSTAYAANITVVLPSPLGNYSKVIPLTTTSQGTARTQLTYPDPSFEPSGSTTVYTGSYTAYFNISESLAQDTFFVGFTDRNEYHRQDTVTIRAVGYQPSQTATLAITREGGSVFTQPVNASNQGVIATTWAVPSTAAIGQYTVVITPTTTAKAITDSQTFTIPGYPVDFRTINLAGERVPQILVEALDQAISKVYTGTTGIDGAATINLEKGNHTVDAYLSQVKVGEINVSITGNNTYDIRCQLTNLKITVQDKNGVRIPFANLNLTYQYTPTKTSSQLTGSASGQTDLSGTCTFNSTLPGINYVIDAFKYDVVFNVGNNTVSNLPAQPVVQVTLLCPDETLTLSTVDYNLAALPNARIELIEQASGIFYSATTNDAGVALVQVTFGQYRLKVYTADNILLNETVVNVLSNTQSQIRCVLYNLHVSVKVVDYFGNPIPNVNVQLSRLGMSTQSAVTQGDGTATFNNVIGGEIEVTAYPAGNDNSYVARTLTVDSPTVVQLQMGSYVVLAGLLMSTSLLATLIIVLVAILLLLSVEIYKRKGFKLLRKSES